VPAFAQGLQLPEVDGIFTILRPEAQ